MSDTLRDQLLGLGFKPAPKPERKPEHKSGKPAGHKHGHKPQGKPSDKRGGPPEGRPGSLPEGKLPRSREEMDLAKAYALRAQEEKNQRIAAERQKQEEARQRREAKVRLDELLKDKALNVAEAEHVRHFPYGGKIKRIHVTAEQLKALNAGELGVVQSNGRYLLVYAATVVAAEAIFPQAVALKVDPNAPVEEDPYADPQYQVPDDLVW
ncbi:MAG: DUF2058 family protein [Pseudoxanthomonas sp.]